MRSMTMSALLAALLASASVIPAAAAEGQEGTNTPQDMQQNRSHRGVWDGVQTRGDARGPQGDAGTVRGEQRAFSADGNSSARDERHLNQDPNRVSRDVRNQRHDNQRRFANRDDRHRFAYRGRGHAFGRYGTDRRFWGHGANQRFGRYSGHPRFGSQWGHRSPHSSINRMQSQQRRSITRGIRSGALTQHEARRLQAEQRTIRRQERAYLADGRLSGHERRHLFGRLHSANQHIYNQTHDRQRRR